MACSSGSTASNTRRSAAAEGSASNASSTAQSVRRIKRRCSRNPFDPAGTDVVVSLQDRHAFEFRIQAELFGGVIDVHDRRFSKITWRGFERFSDTHDQLV